jgi:tetratricopeptide (TPR) repeat protein
MTMTTSPLKAALAVAREGRGRSSAEELPLWQDVLALDPSNKSGLLNATRCAVALGDANMALRYAEAAHAAAPDDGATLTWLARALRAADKNDEALATWRRVIEVAPSAAAHTQAARLATLLSDHDAAVHHCREAAALNPDEAAPGIALIRALSGAGRLDQAWRQAEELIARFPLEFGPVLELGRIAALQGHRDQARLCWEKVLLLAPGNLTATVRLADTLRAEGDLTTALSVIDAADPSFRSNRSRVRARARILIALGRFDEAVKESSMADDSTPSGQAMRDELAGLALLGDWRLDEAERRLLASCLGEPLAHRWTSLTICRLISGDLGGAAQAYENWAQAVRTARAVSAPADDRVIRATAGILGDVMNEHRMNLSAAAESRRAIEARDPHLAVLAVRSHPGALSAASALLVTLRLTGALAVTPPDPSAGQGIPPVIGQAWFGSPLPDDVARLVESWSAMHPGWQHMVFSTDSARAWLAAHHGQRAVSAFRAARHPATKADLFRLAFLATNGGVWCDIDDRPVRPLDDLVQGRRLVCWQEPFATIGNNVIAVAPGHPAITGALEEVLDNVLAGFSEATWLATGPGLLTRSVADWLSNDLSEARLGTETVILRPHELARFVGVHQPLAYKRGPLAWQRAEGHVIDAAPRTTPTAER